MKISDLLVKAQKLHLRSEMEVFLANLLKLRRLDLLTHGEEEVPVEKLSDLQKGWTKILDGVPVAYLTHEKEFYGLTLYVDERVLVPRGETEQLVDFVLELAVKQPDLKKVLEIGTGSGAIAIALKKTRPSLKIVAAEFSEEAMAVANKNIVQLGVDVELLRSDLFENVPQEDFDILVANLPYIGKETNNFISENVEKHEPHTALFGGEDGLRLYARMFEQISEQGRRFKWILGEIGFMQGEDMRALAEELLPDYKVQILKDYQDLDRYFILES